MVLCFRPQIEALLYHRDEVLKQRQTNGLEHVLEDRELEIIGTIPIDVESWVGKLEVEQRRQLARQVQPHHCWGVTQGR